MWNEKLRTMDEIIEETKNRMTNAVYSAVVLAIFVIALISFCVFY